MEGTVQTALVVLTSLFFCLAVGGLVACVCQRYHMCCFRLRKKRVYHSEAYHARIQVPREANMETASYRPRTSFEEEDHRHNYILVVPAVQGQL